MGFRSDTKLQALWICVCLIGMASHALAREGWRAKEDGKSVELMTPYGIKEIMGDFAPNSAASYRIEIPMDELKRKSWAEPERLPASESGESKPEKAAPLASAPVLDSAKIPLVKLDESDQLTVEANRLFNRGKYYQASAVVEEILRRNPENTRAWIMKGSLMKVQGHRDLAQKAWRQAKTLDPKNRELDSLLEQTP